MQSWSSTIPTPLTVGSAPAGVSSDSSALRTLNFRKPSLRGIVPEADRKQGVLHRIDSQVGFHSSTNLNRVEQTRCPSCRLSCKLMCSNCVFTILRINKIRDANHKLFLQKAELSRLIDSELKVQMCFQSDMFTWARSVRVLKEKIAEKTESVNMLKRKLAETKIQVMQTTKTARTLMDSVACVASSVKENEKHNMMLMQLLREMLDENCRYNRFFSILLAHYFPLKKFERKYKLSDSTVEDQVRSSTKAQPPAKAWPPKKNFCFTINGCEINENSKYESLIDELVNSSPMSLSKRTRQPFAALQYATQFVNTLAVLIDYILPHQFTLQEFVVWNRWSLHQFSCDTYRLNTNVMVLCAAYGLANEQLTATNPFNNLLQLVRNLQKEENPVHRNVFTEQIKNKLVEAFKRFKSEERQQELDVEHRKNYRKLRWYKICNKFQIEEDWVSVNFAGK